MRAVVIDKILYTAQYVAVGRAQPLPVERRQGICKHPAVGSVVKAKLAVNLIVPACCQHKPFFRLFGDSFGLPLLRNNEILVCASQAHPGNVASRTVAAVACVGNYEQLARRTYAPADSFQPVAYLVVGKMILAFIRLGIAHPGIIWNPGLVKAGGKGACV